MGWLLRVQSFDVFHLTMYCVGGLLYMQYDIAVSFSRGDQWLLMEISWEDMIGLVSLERRLSVDKDKQSFLMFMYYQTALSASTL